MNVQTIDDIADGTVLWKVLGEFAASYLNFRDTLICPTGEIDENQFSGALPSPVGGNIPSAAWIRKANNLKHIHSVLADYIIYRCRRKLPLPSGEPDLTAIAQSGSETAAVQLLKLVLLAAVFGRFSMEHIQKLTSLSADTQAQFYLILEEPEAYGEEEKCVMGQDSDQDDGQIATIPENAHETDQDFVYEERIAQLVVVNKRWEQETLDLQEQLENLHDLQTRLQKSYDNLEVQHRDTVERLNALRSGKGEQSMLGIQRTKMQQQETVIATLESQISSLREENIDLKVQNDHLVTQTHDLQPMQDQVFELKIENEQLQRKANAADKYKEKLQSLHKVEEENERLKYRVNEMQRELKQGDSEHFNNSDLRRENDELRRLVSNIEQELSDSIEAKKRAEFEKLTFEAKAQQADEQASRWCGKVQSLQRLLNDDPGSDSTSTPRASTSDDFGSTLYDEMDEQDSGLSKGISDVRLEDQNLITEEELQAVISVMKAHTQYTSVTERSSSIQEQQKLAAKLEKTRAITKELIQVFTYLALPRVEFVGVKDLDQQSPFKTVAPPIDDLVFTYGAKSRSARSSVTSLPAASRRSSVTSFHSTHSDVNAQRASTGPPRPGSLLRFLLGSNKK